MDLLTLKMKSIISQLDYLKLDFEYKQRMVETGDKDFIIMMNEILDENPELRDTYKEKEKKSNQNVIKEILNKANKEEEKYQESLNSNDPNEEDNLGNQVTPKKNIKVKKLYRQIVKLTHPDKINDVRLNDLYLEATESYNNNNLYGIYKVCNELHIEYDLDESEILFMDNEINSFKGRIGSIEGTYTWKWVTAPDENIKKQVIIEFINMRLNSPM